MKAKGDTCTSVEIRTGFRFQLSNSGKVEPQRLQEPVSLNVQPIANAVKQVSILVHISTVVDEWKSKFMPHFEAMTDIPEQPKPQAGKRAKDAYWEAMRPPSTRNMRRWCWPTFVRRSQGSHQKAH